MKFRDHAVVIVCAGLLALVAWWMGFDDGGETDAVSELLMPAVAIIIYAVGVKLYRRWRVTKT